MNKGNCQLLLSVIFILSAVSIRDVTGACAFDQNCLSCTTATDCTSCKAFFGLNSATHKCEACNTQPNCLLCSNMTGCSSCATTGGPFGPNPSSPGCGACTANCASCSSAGAGKCDSGRCSSGYYLDSTGACTPCTLANCGTCTATACTSCKAGFSLTATPACIQCSTNCGFCFNAGTGMCDYGRCNAGFGSVGTSTPTTCAACTATNCNQCNNNATSGVSPTSGTCGRCKAGYTLQPDNTCSPSPCTTVPNCNVCFPNTQRCTNCTEPYGVDPATGTCKLCTDQANCSRCDNITLCTRCTNILTDGPKKDGSGECGPCGSNCIDCSVNGADKCDTCKEGYYVDSTQTCKPCDVLHCGKCPQNPTCQTCATGYKLVGSTCDACAPNCSFCFTNGAGKCDGQRYCDTGFTFNTVTMLCDAPPTTTAVQTTTVAQTTAAPTTPPPLCQSIPNCIDCHVDPTACITCDIGYGTTADNQCAPCNTAGGCSRCQNVSMCTECTVLDKMGPLMDGSGGCGACDPNCLECPTNGATFCDTGKCNPGYYLDSTNHCAQCSFPNCKICQTPTTCQACLDGFGFDSTKSACNPCGTCCSFCSTNGPTFCDGPRYCATGTTFNTATKVCDGTCATSPAPTTVGQTTVALSATMGPTTSMGPTTMAQTTVGPTTSMGPTTMAQTTVGPTTSMGPTTMAPTTGGPTTPPAESTTEASTGPTTPPPACISVQHCVDCHLNQLECITCEIGFGLTTDKQCDPCNKTGGCSKCTEVSMCTDCNILDKTGPLADGSGGCGACDPNCLECPTNGATFCDTGKCNPGFYLDATNHCKPCGISNCGRCPTNTSCDQCLSGFAFDSPTTKTSCSACAPSCSFCGVKGVGNCDSQAFCDAGTTFNSATFQCDGGSTTPSSQTTAGPTTMGPTGESTTPPVATGTMGSTTMQGSVGSSGPETTPQVNSETAASAGPSTTGIEGTTGGGTMGPTMMTGSLQSVVPETTSPGTETTGAQGPSTAIAVTTGGELTTAIGPATTASGPESTTGASPASTTSPPVGQTTTTPPSPSSSPTTQSSSSPGPSTTTTSTSSTASLATTTTIVETPSTSSNSGSNNRNLLLYILLPIGIAVGAAALGCLCYICSRGSPFGSMPAPMPPPVYQPMPQPVYQPMPQPVYIQRPAVVAKPIVRTVYRDVPVRSRGPAIRYTPRPFDGGYGGGFGGRYM